MLPDALNADLCRRCGGACCKSGFPGVSTPEDWGAPDKLTMRLALMKALISRKYIVAAESKQNADGYWTVRPNTRANRHCVFLDITGCTLDHKPEGCRTLIPSTNFPDCKQPTGVDLDYWGARWLPFKPMLAEILSDLNLS